MPDIGDVLNACLDDLDKPNSKLAIESANRHQGSLVTKKW